MNAQDHTAVLAGLAPDLRAQLTQKDTWTGLKHLAGHSAAILLTGSYIAFQLPLWGLVMIPHGILLVFLFALSHECTHATPFGPRWLNTLVGHLIAPILALPFTWFRYFHMAHHKHTNDPDLDPELSLGGRPMTLGAYLRNLSGWDTWTCVFRTLVAHARGDIEADYLPEARHGRMIIEAQMILLIYVFAALSLLVSPILLWVWIVPVVLGQPVLRLFLLAEHGGCPPVANMFENSRTTVTARGIRWLSWNMSYHAEHHAYPSVPFHQLPALHDEVRPHLKTVSDGYVAFHRDYTARLDLLLFPL